MTSYLPPAVPLYRAEPDADGVLYRAGGVITAASVRPASGATASTTGPVTVQGYAVRWRKRGIVDEGVTESFADVTAIRNRPLQLPLRLGHGPTEGRGARFGGPTLAESTVECRPDPLGLWCQWLLDPVRPEVTPEVLRWLALGERGLSLGWINLRPPVVHERASGLRHLNPTAVWVTHVAVLPPGQVPAYPDAHTLLSVA